MRDGSESVNEQAMQVGGSPASAQWDGYCFAAIPRKQVRAKFGVLAPGQRERGGLHVVIP